MLPQPTSQPHGPTLRATAISGREQGSIAFGSARDWRRSLTAEDVARASAGAAPIFEERGSFWRLELHRPARPAAVRDAA
ncbi:hypothetical protein [Roseomonas indoligenes]|uniref:Uncharacterized protein n=1 Tax=Roseomonas indoligenes TaxID=2820811 RepID=A0A940MUT9_9PROT|nr:hypothetical protein [Pararoseomonas indoligenes]MBP0492113.1 hypothetical protein [Pararoseomonas indoligenes]